MAVSISSGENTSSNDALTLPSPPTTKRNGSVDRPNAVVASAGTSPPEASSCGWSDPLAKVSLYGSTLMNVISGCAAATGFNLSSVGPHVWDVQNFGVAKISTNGLWAA